MANDSRDYSLLIAGAGPVGMVAALKLGRAGAHVTVLEASSGLSAESRASTFHPPTLEMLDELGLVDELRAQGLEVPKFQHRDRSEGLIAEFDIGTLCEQTRFPFRIQCEQSKLTRILLRKTRSLDNVDVVFDAEVSDVNQDAEQVTATLTDGRQFYGNYLIGADGANSAVRRSLDVGFEGMTYPERYLVISTDEDLRAWMPDISYVNYISDPDEWLVLLRTPEHWRAMFPVRPEETDQSALATDNIQRLMGTIGERSGGWPVLHTTLYRVHQRIATAYRVGRVFLAGDAAHINNPLGGLGMNSGIHDAFLLADLLVDRLNNRIDDAGLDTYEAKRRAVSTGYVATETDQNWRRIREGDETRRQEHFASLRKTAADPAAHREYVRQTCMLSDRADARGATGRSAKRV